MTQRRTRVPEPQGIFERIRQETPVIRWDKGLGIFGIDDTVAAARNPALVSANPDTGDPSAKGSR